ncbi:MAG: 5'/3'-nucleotidase SurE, partial [Chloroflexota bacterium]
IMLTNDDGIASPGLRALIHATHDLGDLLVVAPRHQQSAMSRSYQATVGATETHTLAVNGVALVAYSVEATPAQAVRNGLLRFAPRKPDLLISGINYGENVGAGLTVSGTVGAAWEGAAMGVPALAVSLEVEIEHHFQHSEDVDFAVAAHFARLFAQAMLQHGLAPGVDIMNINVPEDATTTTPWQLTRVSNYSHFHAIVKENEFGEKVLAGYHRQLDFSKVTPDSDIYVVFKARHVSVTPLTIDATARTSAAEIMRRLPPR